MTRVPIEKLLGEGGKLPSDSESQRQKFLSLFLSLSLSHLWRCIFKALSNTCADNVLASLGKVRGVMDPSTDCPRARISVTCQTLLPFVPRPQKSALSAYKLITCSKRFECPSTRHQAQGTRRGMANLMASVSGSNRSRSLLSHSSSLSLSCCLPHHFSAHVRDVFMIYQFWHNPRGLRTRATTTKSETQLLKLPKIGKWTFGWPGEIEWKGGRRGDFANW